MRLSNSHRQFLLRATEKYASQINLATDYLLTRGLSVEEAQKFHLGVVADPLPGHEAFINRLAIPYITPSGVIDIRFRSMHGEEPKYMGMAGAKTSMFNTTACFQAKEYICVTEGEIDAITMAVKTVHPTVGIPGANNWKPHYTRILDDFDTVVILTDGDNAGSEFGKKISRELPNANVVPMLEDEDVNSTFLKYGKEWIDERIKGCLAD